MKLKLSYINGRNNKLPKNFNGLIVLFLFAIAVIGIGPLIADQVSNNGNLTNQTDTSTATLTQPDTATLEILDTATASLSSDTSTSSNSSSSDTTSSSNIQNNQASPAISPTPVKTPAHAIADQSMIIQIPSIQRIDPRSSQFTLPSINFYSRKSSFLMVCMVSSRGNIDISTKGRNDSFSGMNKTLKGDMAARLYLSGEQGEIVDLINSQGGMKLKDPSGKPLTGAVLSFNFVALSEFTDNFNLCDQADEKARWSLTVQALGIDMDTKKSSVSLGDKRK